MKMEIPKETSDSTFVVQISLLVLNLIKFFVKVCVLWQYRPFLARFALRRATFWSICVHFGRPATEFHKLNGFQNARILLCHLPRLFALSKSLSKSSIVPNKGSMDLKSEISYPKSAIGDLKMGESHTPSTPMSFRWSSFSVIPKRKEKKWPVKRCHQIRLSSKQIRTYLMWKHGNLFEETLTESCRWQSFQVSNKDVYFTGSF